MSTFRGVKAAVCASVLLASNVAWGTAQVQVDVSSQRVRAGEAFNVVYAVRIVNESAARVLPMSLGGLEALTDTDPPELPMMMFGGAGFAMTLQTSRQYVLRAPRAGRFTISGARVVDGRTGRVLAQQSPIVIVAEEVPGVPSVGVPTDPDAGAPVEQPTDPDEPPRGDLTGAVFDPNVFIRVAVDNPRPFLGQQVVFRAWVYTRSGETECAVSREPTLQGFWNESLAPGQRECALRWFRTMVADRPMSVALVRRIALFPTQTGTLSIGALTAAVQTMSGGVFGFMQPVDRMSPPLQVEVQEPPRAGRPDGYVPGTVGPITMQTEADRTELPVGETVTVTVRATSEGFLASARPVLPTNIDGLRIRAGEVRTERSIENNRLRNTLVLQVLLVPERPGTIRAGAVSIPYWNPAENRYDVARAELPELRVTGTALTREQQRGANDPLAELRPLTRDPSLSPHSRWFVPGAFSLAFSFAPVAMAGLGLFAQALMHRRKRSVLEREEERREDPEALLEQAKELLPKDSAQAVSFAAKALDRARRSSDEMQLNEDGKKALEEAMAACEAVRFAGAADDPAKLVSLVDRAVRALLEVP